MAPIFTRTLSAGASMALTIVMVAASASAFVPAPATARTKQGIVRRMALRVADLNLDSAAGRQTFERRLAVAVDRVCPEDTNQFDAARCRSVAIEQARHAVGLVADAAS